MGTNIDATLIVKILHTLTESMASIEAIITHLDRKVDSTARQDIIIQKLENIELKLKQDINDILKISKSELSSSLTKTLDDVILKIDGIIQKRELKNEENKTKIKITEKENKNKILIAIISLISILLSSGLTLIIQNIMKKP